jgi:hypothetical protein
MHDEKSLKRNRLKFSGKLHYPFEKDKEYWMGKQNTSKGWHPDIVLAGVGIQEKHCRITNTSEKYTIDVVGGTAVIDVVVPREIIILSIDIIILSIMYRFNASILFHQSATTASRL